MTDYDIRAFQRILWVRITFCARVAFVVFGVTALAWTSLNVYSQLRGGGFGALQLFVTVFLFLIPAIFLYIGIRTRTGATDLVIDATGVSLRYAHGRPESRTWSDPKIRIRGRWTAGAQDIVSRGKPMWSVFGLRNSMAEAFLDRTTFARLVAAAKEHGLTLMEEPNAKQADWTIYWLARE